ncbi:PDR/VanB family oxidoreductase [Arthrobacter ginkgonis]|uniref:PDR/VanB family oxidoreductase n=1 Tax=Arthrobacter ginkgonis TaxID=1630594 RepID=A0ABP7C3N5_9MICC
MSPAETAPRGASLIVTGQEHDGDVAVLTLADPQGGRLPEWAPGAHIDLHLGHGRIRQYSLCGDRTDAGSYRVGVRLEANGTGGSRHLHENVRVGDLVEFGGPRNNFRLHPAPSYLFLAAGIGITPILPMMAAAERLGIRWRCIVLGRTRASVPFLADLEAYGERVRIIETAHEGRPRAEELLDGADTSTAVYACGPFGFLEALEDAAAGRPLAAGGLRIEHFTAATATATAPDTAFEVELVRSGRIVPVAPGQSILAALRGAGTRLLASCERGLCGTCDTDVVAGTPDHRDSVLAAHERAVGDCLMPCVSRSLTPRLALDL